MVLNVVFICCSSWRSLVIWSTGCSEWKSWTIKHGCGGRNLQTRLLLPLILKLTFLQKKKRYITEILGLIQFRILMQSIRIISSYNFLLFNPTMYVQCDQRSQLFLKKPNQSLLRYTLKRSASFLYLILIRFPNYFARLKLKFCCSNCLCIS